FSGTVIYHERQRENGEAAKKARRIIFGTDMFTLSEFVMGETLSIGAIHQSVFQFLQGRTDLAVYGAQAVNAYVTDEPRMTQDIDLVSTRAEALASEVREHLATEFHIAVRVRKVAGGNGFRVYQIRQPSNWNLVDVRQVDTLPETERKGDIPVVALAPLIASKVVAYTNRRGHYKSGTDFRDVALMLLRFPEYKRDPGPVTEALCKMGDDRALTVFRKEFLHPDLKPDQKRTRGPER
ncbi:MAG: nucleotidyl transferase AbiEii/AbiGii toxin family protein, partial [Candidatus Tectomicrobia bacterium]|nr:nucleotidyl transferase AbiEii/AbiGii toxin family protein [Candidatus Tectomicrobia bacterium]